MVSMRGPRRCASTFASTSTPSTSLPTLTPLPSLRSRTRPSFTEEPGSAASWSTRMRSPGATRYCLPPLTTTADRELSGLGTASDCTKRWDCSLLVHKDPPANNHRLDQPERRQGRYRGRAPVRDQRQGDARDRQQPDVHPHVLDDLDEHHDEGAAREQLAEPIRREGGRTQGPDEKGAKEREQNQAAEKPELLGEGGEDEIG